jgi:hypothetical protein
VDMAEENQIHLLLPKTKIRQTNRSPWPGIDNVAMFSSEYDCSVMSYLVLEQEWLNRGDKVRVHAGRYT